MIKGQVFANQLFENQIFALFINTFTDGANGVSDNYKNGMAITYSGSDLTIDSGAVLIQGRFLEEDTSTTISAGADNMYCKLVIEIDLDKTNTTTEFNQGYYKIVKGANDYPALTQTNIVKNVSGVYQYELARFRNPSSGITDFQDRRTFIDFDSIYDEIEQHIHDIDEGSIFVLKDGTITLNGAVSGSASFNSSSDLTITTTQSNIAVLTGTLTSSGNYVDQVNYPTGYNQGNCVVLSCMIGGTDTGDPKSQGLVFTGSDASSKNPPFKVVLASGYIGIMARSSYITISSGGAIVSTENTAPLSYKVVLMKIA